MSDTSQDQRQYQMPPFFKSWKSIYWLVLGNLAMLVILFYLLTQYYA